MVKKKPMRLDNEKMVAGFEGGAIYTGEKDGKPAILVNQAAVIDILPEEERQDFLPIRIVEFESIEQRARYLLENYNIKV